LEVTHKEIDISSPAVDVGEAARIMREKDVGSVLVAEAEKLVGIITERDFFKIIV